MGNRCHGRRQNPATKKRIQIYHHEDDYTSPNHQKTNNTQSPKSLASSPQRAIENRDTMHIWDNRTSLDQMGEKGTALTKEKQNEAVFQRHRWTNSSEPFIVDEAHASLGKTVHDIQTIEEPFDSMLLKNPQQYSNKRPSEFVFTPLDRNGLTQERGDTRFGLSVVKDQEPLGPLNRQKGNLLPPKVIGFSMPFATESDAPFPLMNGAEIDVVSTTNPLRSLSQEDDSSHLSMTPFLKHNKEDAIGAAVSSLVLSKEEKETRFSNEDLSRENNSSAVEETARKSEAILRGEISPKKAQGKQKDVIDKSDSSLRVGLDNSTPVPPLHSELSASVENDVQLCNIERYSLVERQSSKESTGYSQSSKKITEGRVTEAEGFLSKDTKEAVKRSKRKKGAIIGEKGREGLDERVAEGKSSLVVGASLVNKDLLPVKAISNRRQKSTVRRFVKDQLLLQRVRRAYCKKRIVYIKQYLSLYKNILKMTSQFVSPNGVIKDTSHICPLLSLRTEFEHRPYSRKKANVTGYIAEKQRALRMGDTQSPVHTIRISDDKSKQREETTKKRKVRHISFEHGKNAARDKQQRDSKKGKEAKKIIVKGTTTKRHIKNKRAQNLTSSVLQSNFSVKDHLPIDESFDIRPKEESDNLIRTDATLSVLVAEPPVCKKATKEREGNFPQISVQTHTQTILTESAEVKIRSIELEKTLPVEDDDTEHLCVSSQDIINMIKLAGDDDSPLRFSPTLLEEYSKFNASVRRSQNEHPSSSLRSYSSSGCSIGTSPKFHTPLQYSGISQNAKEVIIPSRILPEVQTVPLLLTEAISTLQISSPSSSPKEAMELFNCECDDDICTVNQVQNVGPVFNFSSPLQHGCGEETIKSPLVHVDFSFPNANSHGGNSFIGWEDDFHVYQSLYKDDLDSPSLELPNLKQTRSKNLDFVKQQVVEAGPTESMGAHRAGKICKVGNSIHLSDESKSPGRLQTWNNKQKAHVANQDERLDEIRLFDESDGADEDDISLTVPILYSPSNSRNLGMSTVGIPLLTVESTYSRDQLHSRDSEELYSTRRRKANKLINNSLTNRETTISNNNEVSYYRKRTSFPYPTMDKETLHFQKEKSYNEKPTSPYSPSRHRALNSNQLNPPLYSGYYCVCDTICNCLKESSCSELPNSQYIPGNIPSIHGSEQRKNIPKELFTPEKSTGKKKISTNRAKTPLSNRLRNDCKLKQSSITKNTPRPVNNNTTSLKPASQLTYSNYVKKKEKTKITANDSSQFYYYPAAAMSHIEKPRK